MEQSMEMGLRLFCARLSTSAISRHRGRRQQKTTTTFSFLSEPMRCDVSTGEEEKFSTDNIILEKRRIFCLLFSDFHFLRKKEGRKREERRKKGARSHI